MVGKLACLIPAILACHGAFAADVNPTAAESLLSRGVKQVVFAERSFPRDGHWYANFGYFFDGPKNVCYTRQGRLLKLDVHKRRCASCHGKMPALEKYSIAGGSRDGFRDTHLAYNLTRPEKSPMLLMPLARKAGGWDMQKRGSDGKPAGEPVEVFLDTSDPDYGAILGYIETGRLCLQENKRWDMPGFKPHPFYIREMKRYGILPESFGAARDDIDVFDIDRRYWESAWHYPVGTRPALHVNAE